MDPAGWQRGGAIGTTSATSSTWRSRRIGWRIRPLKLKTPALLKQAQERIAEQAHSRQLLEKSGLLEKYIRVRAWLKDSSQFDFAVPDLRLPGPALGPAAAAPAPARGAGCCCCRSQAHA